MPLDKTGTTAEVHDHLRRLQARGSHGLVAQLVGSTHEDDLAMPEHDDPVGDVERVGRVLLDEDHADTLVGRDGHKPSQP